MMCDVRCVQLQLVQVVGRASAAEFATISQAHSLDLAERAFRKGCLAVRDRFQNAERYSTRRFGTFRIWSIVAERTPRFGCIHLGPPGGELGFDFSELCRLGRREIVCLANILREVKQATATL